MYKLQRLFTRILTKLHKMSVLEKTTPEVNLKEATESINILKRDLPVEENQSENANKKLKADQVKKKKVAVLLSYCGHGYMGMQRNPGVITIEDELLGAFLKAELIDKENFDLPQTANFQRAARTDKGVSAARQVVSIKLALGDNLKEKINDFLPPVIRVQSIIKTTRGFNSKFWCDARTYTYTLPTFAFAGINSITNENYRIDDETLQKVNSTLKLFKGTKNFHNFTSGKKFEDASAKRYLIDFECGKPFVESGLEVAVITVKGQSFMLHQIRKMIGAAIAIVRDLTNTDVIEKAWGPLKVDIPIAPGLGLVLEEVHYDKYNKRYSKDGIHEALCWDNVNDEIEAFKRQHIYLPIIGAEIESKSMFNWLSSLSQHSYDIREPGVGNKTAFVHAKHLVESLNALESEEAKCKT